MVAFTLVDEDGDEVPIFDMSTICSRVRHIELYIPNPKAESERLQVIFALNKNAFEITSFEVMQMMYIILAMCGAHLQKSGSLYFDRDQDNHVVHVIFKDKLDRRDIKKFERTLRVAAANNDWNINSISEPARSHESVHVMQSSKPLLS